MRSSRRLAALVATLGLALPAALVAAPSTAAPDTAAPDTAAPAPGRGAPGTWTKVTTGQVLNISEPGLYRTADGVLHVLYPRQNPSSDDIAFTNIGPTGDVVATGDAVSGWAGLPQDPKVVALPGGGMRLVFGGIHDIYGGDPYGTGQMFSATSDEAGTTWTLAPGALTESHYAYASYGTGATTLADGTPVVSFPLNSTLTWNAGAPSDSTYSMSSCCLYDSTLVRDDDEVWVTYAANGDGASVAGLFLKQLLPTDTGPTFKLPRSSEGADTITPSQSTAFVLRPGGGMYAAYCIGYPTCDRIGLWRFGTDQPVTVPGSKGARDISLSTGPGGRLWIAWTTYDRVEVVHTATTGTTFGAVRTIKPPAAAESLYGVFVAGTDGSADVLLNNGSALFHQQVLPGLSLGASPRSWRHGTRQKVVFTATDAGAAVDGARVAAAGRSCTTAATGRCSITFRIADPKRFAATVRADGYGAGTVRLRVR